MSNTISPHEFGTTPLAVLLGLQPTLPPDGKGLGQLDYVESHVREIGGQSLLLEETYVDRDFIGDHSVFYSSSLEDPTNRCRRIHFFSLPPEEIEAKFEAIRKTANEDGRDKYLAACKRFSADCYLGFCVIKPLQASPVGRTVLRPYSNGTKQPGETRKFACTRDYEVHVDGVRLYVNGLAFQQQDMGVSACATTALWSAISKAADFEHIAVPTPADITTLASRYSLPHGRAMPSEGLSVDQMCQAVQGLSLAPALYAIKNIEIAQQYLHTCVLSGLPAVLILKTDDYRHAVALTGSRNSERVPKRELLRGVRDVSSELTSVYVHDDRTGPYLRADVVERDDHIFLDLDLRGPDPEPWQFTHLLVPMHHKIRLGFAGLREMASFVASEGLGLWEATRESQADGGSPFALQTSIVRSSEYIEQLLTGKPFVEADRVHYLLRTVNFSRYVGVVSLEVVDLGRIDTVLDTTSTSRDVKPLCVIAHRPDKQAANFALTLAGDILGIPENWI